MSSPERILTVVGATGAQGGSLISTILALPPSERHYTTIRGLTRDPSSVAARNLTSQGVHMVAADLDSPASLRSVFLGSTAIFVVTNYFEPFATNLSQIESRDIETRRGKNMADAAASPEVMATLQHYLWSSLPNPAQNSSGALEVVYHAGKNAVDAHIRDTLPRLREKTTLVWLSWYVENMLLPTYAPTFVGGFGNTNGGGEGEEEREVLLGVNFFNMEKRGLLPVLGRAGVNAGIWIKAVLDEGRKGSAGKLLLPGGKAVSCVDGYMAYEDIVKAYADAVNAASATTAARANPGEAGKGDDDMERKEKKKRRRRMLVVQVSDDEFADMWPGWGALMAKSHRHFVTMGERSFTSVHGDVEVLYRDDLEGLEGLESARDGFVKFAEAMAGVGQ